jgi:hypothetical protein
MAAKTFRTFRNAFHKGASANYAPGQAKASDRDFRGLARGSIAGDQAPRSFNHWLGMCVCCLLASTGSECPRLLLALR